MKRGAVPVAYVPGSSSEIQQVSLRRRATFDIFRACDYGPPPRILFVYTDDKDDVGAGIEQFLDCIGHPRSEVASPQAVITKLNRLDHAYARLDQSAKLEWLERLLAGDARQTDEVLLELGTGRTSTDVTEDWPEGACPPALLNIASLTQRGSDEDGRMILLMRRLSTVLSAHYRLGEGLAASWPERWYSSPEADQLKDLLDRFQSEDMNLIAMTSSDISTAESSVGIMEDANSHLAVLLARAQQIAGTNAPTVNPSSVTSAATPTDAMKFFGFPVGVRPTQEELMARWRQVRLEHHPDWPGLSAQEVQSRAETSDTADMLLEIMARQRAS